MAQSDAHLPKDATIKHIVEMDTLADPENYVRGVLENMFALRKDFGTPLVRIGILGRGIVPHYQVEKPGLDFDEFIGHHQSGDPVEDRRFVPFNGRSHKEMPPNWGNLTHDHWSNSTVGLDEVKSVLGLIRDIKRP